MQRVTDTAEFLAGFVIGEGCFTRAGDPPKFAFAVTLGAVDAALCELFADVLGVGTIHHRRRRRPHYDDEVTFQVRKLAHLVVTVVPFMDEHLPPSYKRRQYEEWRAALLEYWDGRARRRRTCTVPGCGAPRRAHGLCRRHLYELRGT